LTANRIDRFGSFLVQSGNASGFLLNPKELHPAFPVSRRRATIFIKGSPFRHEGAPMKRWFLYLVAGLVLWIGYNLIAYDEYDASLRPLYWLMEEVGAMGPR
jgi:hypothetical protein